MESYFWNLFPQFRLPPLLHSGTNLVLSFSSLFVSGSLSSHLQSSLNLSLWQKFCSSSFVPRLECFLSWFLEVPVWREMWCFLARRPLTLVLHSGTCRHFSTLVAFHDTPLLCLSVSFPPFFGTSSPFLLLFVSTCVFSSFSCKMFPQSQLSQTPFPNFFVLFRLNSIKN